MVKLAKTEQQNILNVNHVIIKTLIILASLDPIIYYFITKYYVVNSDYFILSGWSWKLSLHLILSVQTASLVLSLFLALISFLLVVVYMGFQVGIIFEMKFTEQRQQNVIAIVLIVLFFIYYIGGIIYLNQTSNPKLYHININKNYELVIGPIAQSRSTTKLTFKVLKDNQKQDVEDIEIKMLKNGKEFLPMAQEYGREYSRYFKPVNTPFNVHIGKIKLVESTDTSVVLDVSKNLRVNQLYIGK